MYGCCATPSSRTRGTVDLAFARPADTVPEDTACPGGCRYELKFDGFRVAVVRTANGARLWSRRGTDLTFAFPDLAAAAEFHLRSGTVLDGEAVVWVDGRLSFDHLQQRLARRAARAGPGDRRPATSPSTCWHWMARINVASPTSLGVLASSTSRPIGHHRWRSAPARPTATSRRRGARITGRPAQRTSPPQFSHLLLGRLSLFISDGHVAGDVPLGCGAILQTEWGAGSRRGVLHDRYRTSLA